MKKNFKVYVRILCGKKYFGSTNKSLEERAGYNGSGYKMCTRLYETIESVGWDKVQSIVLYDNLSEWEAKIIETALIKMYKTYLPEFGYNQTCGDGEKLCKEAVNALIENGIDISILEIFEEDVKGKRTHEEVLNFIQSVKDEDLWGRNVIIKKMKREGFVPSSFSHYLYKSSGGDRFDQEFYKRWMTSEKEYEHTVKSLF